MIKRLKRRGTERSIKGEGKKQHGKRRTDERKPGQVRSKGQALYARGCPAQRSNLRMWEARFLSIGGKSTSLRVGHLLKER